MRASSRFFRTALFAPVVTTLVAVAVIWRYLLHTRYGLVNQGLAALGLAPIDWLGDPHWSMPAIIVFAAWKNFGYNMIILARRAAGHPATSSTRRRASTAPARCGSFTARDAADARADASCWSAS